MRYLISGAAGFIGSHICDQLIEKGHEVLAIDNFITGHTENISHLLSHPNFELLEHDVCVPVAIPGTVDRVFHLASLASPVDYLEHPIETLESGSTGTRNMLQVALEKNARFLVTSTSECYGDPLEHPQRETYWGNVNPVGMRACYDEAKRFGEAYLTSAVRKLGIDGRIVRIFNTYGPRMQPGDGRVIPNFCLSALRGEPLTVYGDGQQPRSFCYVDDLIDGIVRLAKGEGLAGKLVNIGNPVEFTIGELALIVSEVADVPLYAVPHDLPPDDPTRRKPDITLARTLLGWEPKVALREGLVSTLDYFRELTPVA